MARATFAWEQIYFLKPVTLIGYFLPRESSKLVRNLEFYPYSRYFRFFVYRYFDNGHPLKSLFFNSY